MNTTYIVIGVIAVVVIFIFVYVKMTIDEKKGVNSDEKRIINNIIKKQVPGAENYHTLYATWETYDFGGGGRRITTTTTYRYYGVAFNKETVWLVPLSFAGGDVSHSDAVMLNKENLGAVNANKDRLWVEFYDKEHNMIAAIMAAASNTKDDKYHPVNIQQKEEVAQFQADMADFIRNVNDYNGVEVTGKLGKAFKKK